MRMGARVGGGWGREHCTAACRPLHAGPTEASMSGLWGTPQKWIAGVGRRRPDVGKEGPPECRCGLQKHIRAMDAACGEKSESQDPEQVPPSNRYPQTWLPRRLSATMARFVFQQPSRRAQFGIKCQSTSLCLKRGSSQEDASETPQMWWSRGKRQDASWPIPQHFSDIPSVAFSPAFKPTCHGTRNQIRHAAICTLRQFSSKSIPRVATSYRTSQFRPGI